MNLQIRTTLKAMKFEPFPDLDNYTPRIATPPRASRITAWTKLEECERRLVVYNWAERRSDPRTPKNRVFLNDSVSAFLLSFEATLQFIKDQFTRTTSAPNFDQWLDDLPHYDVVRGLRTLRHFEAHVENKPPPSHVKIALGDSLWNGTSASDVSRSWQLPSLVAAELNKLRSSPLKDDHLSDWNFCVANDDVATVFEHGLQKLKAILEASESSLPP